MATSTPESAAPAAETITKMFSRDDIRSALLDVSITPTYVTLPNGARVEVRAPTLAELAAYRNEGGVDDEGKPVVDPDQMAKGIIRHTFIPDTDEHVFEEADLDVVRNLAFHGGIKQLVIAIGKVMSEEEVLDKGVKSAVKSLEA